MSGGKNMSSYTEKEIIENGEVYIERIYDSGSYAKWKKNPTIPKPSEKISKSDLDAAYREGVNAYV